VALSAATAGCFSFSTVTTAEPVPTGQVELTVAPTVTAFGAAAFGDDAVSAGVLLIAPTIDFHARVGVGQDFDLGFSLTGWMQTNLDFKWRFLDTDVIDVAIDPHIGGIFLNIGAVGGGYVNFGLPVLIDFAFSPNFIFTVTPKYEAVVLMGRADDGSTASTTLHYLGTSFSFQIAFEETRRFLIMPYGGFAAWLNAPGNASDVAVVNMNFGLGFKARF